MSGSNESRTWLALASVLLFGWLIYLLAPILTPFLIAALLAYLGDPLADRLEAWGLPRVLAVVAVCAVLLIVLAAITTLLVPIVSGQIKALANAVPTYVEWINTVVLPWAQRHLDLNFAAFDLAAVKNALSAHLREAGGAAANIVAYVTRSGAVLVGWLLNMLLVPVVAFYLLRDWDLLIALIRGLVPRHVEPTVSRLARESDAVLGAFLRGQLLVMLGLGTIYSIGLSLVGVEFGLLIGLLAGLVSFVPYLGFIVGLTVASIAVLFQTHDIFQLVWVIVVFSIGQMLEGIVLTPWLVGDRIGMHPVAVIFAVLAGGQLFGFFGVLLALPAAAVLAVLIRFVRERYVASTLYEVKPPR
ncbi:MAG TPA: AI-2E family transporter [Gammaproteobacteria bacterium]|nr:AI-2E family transporter [Gammaproteobacteria bacterium]